VKIEIPGFDKKYLPDDDDEIGTFGVGGRYLTDGGEGIEISGVGEKNIVTGSR
jgi:hypothetical protein